MQIAIAGGHVLRTHKLEARDMICLEKPASLRFSNNVLAGSWASQNMCTASDGYVSIRSCFRCFSKHICMLLLRKFMRVLVSPFASSLLDKLLCMGMSSWFPAVCSRNPCLQCDMSPTHISHLKMRCGP